MQRGQTRTNLDIRSYVFRDVRTVALRQNGDFLLDIFNLVLCFFQVDYFDCNHLLRPLIDALVDLAERPFADPFLFGEDLIGVGLLQCQRATNTVR